ncbi:dual specificity protein phosphatase 3-like [Oppia nitens]|uniref:dual specificity protein phosphatase 3-like n=1 Tax=Oppia nitens TaxID=1686743 RepID=UPI0023DBF13B|nr:dual specificity protein phosphatase 3-like [Oppia nitens]
MSDKESSDEMCWWKSTLKTCTPQELRQIIDTPTVGLCLLANDSYNKVFDGIYIGDEIIAMNIPLLKSLSISHVLNASFGDNITTNGLFNFVNTGQQYYSESGIQFMGIEAIDHLSFNLYHYFDISANFIESAINDSGNVLVHCKEGVSRSVTLVSAYLMIKKGMTAQQSIRIIRQNREIAPNEGFLRQLAFLNDILFNKSDNNS